MSTPKLRLEGTLGKANNHCGQIFQQFDGAGVVTNEAYDFKGNLVHSNRRLLVQYRTTIDWSTNPLLESGLPFTSRYTFDALNRSATQTMPDGSVVHHLFNEANLLNQVTVNLRGAAESALFIENIDYDAKGQPQLMTYVTSDGANVTTVYEYDSETFRLYRFNTVRGSHGAVLQDLRYVYDPTGNITRVTDRAQTIVFFRNQRVDPAADYVYDAVYRLIHASGREHLGQNGGGRISPPIPPSSSDSPRVGLLHPGDRNAMGLYREHYEYDSVGNILSMRHQGSDPAHSGWKRCYQYALETNRLLSMGHPNDPNNPDSDCLGHHAVSPLHGERFNYDSHGNMIRMPHLGGVNPDANMHWDYRDQLQHVELGGSTAYYVYSAAGQRVRKVIDRQNGTRREERLYLGGYELYREYNGNGATVVLARETLHIMDDARRIALLETQTIDSQVPIPNPQPLIRYQFANHLGSAGLELDDAGRVISYEEYYPYGGTSYQASRGDVEVSARRYRYTGKERDEETGLYYHGARYFAPWLGRWTSSDPAGLADGPNLYVYARNNPLSFTDPNGKWSWGKTLGLVAAIGVGVAITALSGGVLGPVAAGIVAGAAAGAAGEIVEAAVDGRPITAKNVLISAGIGAAFGGVFAGAGQLIARTQVGQRLMARMTSSAVGQALARTVYRAATSPSRAAGVARTVASRTRQGLQRIEEAGEAVGRRMGGRFAANASQQSERRAALEAARADAAAGAGNRGVQATLQGEVNGQPFRASTRSGVDRSGSGVRAIDTPAGRVQAPAADAVPDVLRPLPVPGGSGQAFVRGADAEFKLFGHTLLSTEASATGRLSLGVTAPICPSCTANLWSTRAALPGVQIIDGMSLPTSGAAGAADIFIPPVSPESDLTPVAPILEIRGSF